MRSKLVRSAVVFSFIVLAGLAGGYAASSEADALDLSALPHTASAANFVADGVIDEQIVREDLRKLARQAMNDLIASGRNAQN